MNLTNPSPHRLSLLVIEWLNGEAMLRNFILQPLFCDIKKLQASFSQIICSRVYWEKNLEANKLSQDGYGLQEGTWKINESLSLS